MPGSASARGFARNVSRWLNQTVYVARQTGRDASGNPSWSDPEPIRARVEGDFRRQFIENEMAEVVESDFTFISQEPIGKQDRIWLPQDEVGDLTKARIPQRTALAPYFDGDTVFYQTWV
jgi:hypothetical protein